MNPLAKIHTDLIQGSDEWFRARLGRATASQAKRIITAAKGDYSKQAPDYAAELIAECLAPNEPPSFAGNWATDRGNEMEPHAIAAFEAQTGLKVQKVGFISVRLREDSPVDIVGLSPDGLVLDSDGFDYCAGLEVKCPLRTQHVQNALTGELPDDYKQQVHWSLALTKLPEWHFWSWHPDIQPVHYVVRPDAYTEKVSAAIEQFVCEYVAMRTRLVPKLQLPPGLSE